MISPYYQLGRIKWIEYREDAAEGVRKRRLKHAVPTQLPPHRLPYRI